MSEHDPFASPGDTIAVRERARMSSTFGLVAVICCLLLPCASCMSLLVAIPLSLAAIQMGRSVLAASAQDEVAEVQARHGVSTGLVALIYSGLILSIFIAYFMLYFGVIAAVVLSEL